MFGLSGEVVTLLLTVAFILFFVGLAVFLGAIRDPFSHKYDVPEAYRSDRRVR